MSDSTNKRQLGKRKENDDYKSFEHQVTQSESQPEVEDVAEKQPASLLDCYVWPVVVEHAGSQYNVAYTVQSPIQAFLVPVGEFVPSTKRTQLLVDAENKYIRAYDWKDELEKLVPDVETVRRNFLVSFLRVGAVNRAAASDPAVRNNMFNSAFPYKLEE
jgi:hypothetical protein